MRGFSRGFGIFSNNDYLPWLQIKYDCETIYGLIKSLQRDGVTSFGVIPYFTLTAATILEMLSSKEIKIEIPYSARIKDKIVVGNTQYNYYLLQDNRFAIAYEVFPNNFNLDEHVNKECYQYAYTCTQFINSVRAELEAFDTPVTLKSNKNIVKFYYADYNTNRKSALLPQGENGKSALLPQGENGKSTFLYLLHTLSTTNFLLYVLNDYEKDDYGWWLKINYIVYYYSIHKLTDLHEHFVQNKLMTQNISDYLNEIDIKNAKFMNSTFWISRNLL